MRVESARRSILLVAMLFGAMWVAAPAQRVAFVVPEAEAPASGFAEAIESAVKPPLHVVDRDLAAAAFRATAPAEPFNMSAENAAITGSAIGANYFVVVRSRTQRRAGAGEAFYFDSFGAFYLVDARSGALILWDIRMTRGVSAAESEKSLFGTAASVAGQIADAIRQKPALSNAPRNEIAGPPDDGSPASQSFKPPAPYRRIAPAYTPLADLYAIEATIDIEVDFDADGKITATKIVRWAGFGLEESVERAVRSMNWRPAFQNNKPRPVRVLLRYNFRKLTPPVAK